MDFEKMSDSEFRGFYMECFEDFYGMSSVLRTALTRELISREANGFSLFV